MVSTAPDALSHSASPEHRACGQLSMDERDWCRMVWGPHVSGEGLPRSSECADWPGLEGAGPFQGGKGGSGKGQRLRLRREQALRVQPVTHLLCPPGCRLYHM